MLLGLCILFLLCSVSKMSCFPLVNKYGVVYTYTKSVIKQSAGYIPRILLHVCYCKQNQWYIYTFKTIYYIIQHTDITIHCTLVVHVHHWGSLSPVFVDKQLSLGSNQ